MLCQNCNKNEATVHVEQIINNEKTIYNLCSECASTLSSANSFDDYFKNILGSFFAESYPKQSTKEKTPDKTLKCANCGLTFEIFRKTGRFGCVKCYETFENMLDNIFNNIHGRSVHEGKISSKASPKLKIKKEIDVLREQLATEINNENYEKAAEIRDKIRALSADQNE